MDTRLLGNFMAIVDCGSLSRAAEKLHVAQPALSHQLAGLEATFGTRLLIRSPGGVKPTKAGTALYRRARAILAQMDSLAEAVRTGGEPESGSVAVGLPTSTAGLVAVPLLERLMVRHPAIQLTLFESLSGYIADRVASGRLDLALLFRDTPTIGLAALPLLTEELFLIGEPRLFSLADDEPCPLHRLDGVPFVLSSALQGLRVLVERSFIQAGIALNVVADCDSLTAVILAARQGLACTILSKSALAAYGGTVGVAVHPLVEPSIRRPVSLCWSTNLPRTAAAIAVQAIVVDLVGKLVADGRWGGAEACPLNP